MDKFQFKSTFLNYLHRRKAVLRSNHFYRIISKSLKIKFYIFTELRSDNMDLKIHTKCLLLMLVFICLKCKCNARGLTSIGSHHIIGLSYQNDCILSLGGFLDEGYYSNLTAQAGFAFNDYLAIQMGYHNFTGNPYFFAYNRFNYTDYTDDHFAQTAVGLFYPIAIKNAKKIKYAKNKPRHILLDVYVGYGKGINLRSLVK